MTIDKKRLIELLDRLIDKHEKWYKDADQRGDSTDMIYYEGQQDSVKEVKEIISNW